MQKLKTELDALKRNRFGRSSEKLERRIDQLEFALEELEIDVADEKPRNPPTQNATGKMAPCEDRPVEPVAGRRQFPAYWPRERIEHKAACVCPGCGGTKLVCIGTDEREVLAYVKSY